ncbi:protein kinase domain-containing protein [Plantactinospora sonchi]|uniref:non-specific serine/threonine protein kinase n=1 Tax=Plantactinospora sonchi TaxID=1544735 RepID=A0ABU7RYK6_9ACTN
MTLEQGSIFAGYSVERLIGAGGTGEVYAARHPRLSRRDALKVLPVGGENDSGYRARFEQTVDAVARLRHPNIVAVHDRGEFDGRLWIAMDLIDGRSVAEIIRTTPTGLPPAQVSHIAVVMASALDYANSCGVLHRDVRPANILVTSQGHVALTNFGISGLALDETVPSGSGVTVDTVSYSSPEQLQGGHVDGRSDQYSLACTVFRLLTGHDPYENANPVAVIAGHLGQPVPSVRRFHPQLPPTVDAVLARAMAKDPGHRYPSCTEFANSLAASLASAPGLVAYQQPAGPSPVTPQPMPADRGQPGGPIQSVRPGRPTRGRWAIVGAALAACLVLVTAVVLVVRLSGSRDAMAWDDTLYPQEIPSIFRMQLRDELLALTSRPPKLSWTAEVRGGQANIVGGDSSVVVLQSGTSLLGLDMRTGAARWPSVDLHDTVASCAVRENRIGCVAPARNGSDSTVFILDTGRGEIIETVKVPNRDLRSMVVAGDRFIALTDIPDDGGFAAGYTTEGDQLWTREGHDEMYVSAGRGLLVDTAHDADEVVFVNTADGREVLRSTRVVDERDLAWNIFRDGIAIQNQDWTGTDIYDLNGQKKSSVAGWEPAAYQNRYAAASPIPLLVRLGGSAPHYPDRSTVAAANPETGHLLWRISGPELSTAMATVADKLVMQVAAPGASGDSTASAEPTGQEFVRVYDCITGEPLSSPIDMTRSTAVEPYWIESDGDQLVYTYVENRPETPYVVVGYDITSGQREWELPLKNGPEYTGGAIVAATGPEAVSLFR